MTRNSALRTGAILSVSALLVSCSIKQKAVPVSTSSIATREICMIPAKGLRRGFHGAYRSALEAKGFVVREFPSNTPTDVCPLSTRYTGKWSWDAAIYMSFADIDVFWDGKMAGSATYDARAGWGNLNKFIDAEEKIHELVDDLFPEGLEISGEH